MTRKRMNALRYSNDDVAGSPSWWRCTFDFTYSMGWSDSAVRRYGRDAGGLVGELNVSTRCDCTTRNEKKAARLSKRMDELEERIVELEAAEELAALRPELDGNAVMEHLGVGPGREVGEAMKFLRRFASTKASSATTRSAAASTTGGLLAECPGWWRSQL